ncbi:hypothetical protein HPB51_029786 [Rhipicephalus microplus]|uniref:Uncharacterized protein n=1 Tax=Rhipicephalus microplus TaxID=6941 RepID=A0A9J6CTU8_RHIMP|nr:hypothetical protein HPB51_029786 [Rhipicephalus microplus]
MPPEQKSADDASEVANRMPTSMPHRRRLFPAAAQEESDLTRVMASWCWEQCDRAQHWSVFKDPKKCRLRSRSRSSPTIYYRTWTPFASTTPPCLSSHSQLDAGAGKSWWCCWSVPRSSFNLNTRRHEPQAAGGRGGDNATPVRRGHMDRGHVILRSHYGHWLRPRLSERRAWSLPRGLWTPK